MTNVSMWSVYILRCGDGSLYAGVAVDVLKRFRDHSGPRGARYVKAHGGPAEIVWRSSQMSRSDALRTELWIKSRSRGDKLALVSGKLALPDLAA